MTLKTFFTLPYEKKMSGDWGLHPTVKKFDKVFVYTDNFIKAKVRIVNYNESHTHLYFTHSTIKNKFPTIENYLCKHTEIDGKILITNLYKDNIIKNFTDLV